MDLKDITEEEIEDIYNSINLPKDYNTISPSSLKKYVQMCQLAYFFDYVKKWKFSFSTPELELGTSLHSAFEKLNRKKAFDKTRSKEELLSDFKSSWEENKDNINFKDAEKTQEKIKKAGDIGEGLVERYIESYLAKSLKPVFHKPLNQSLYVPAVEMEIDIPIYSFKRDQVLHDDYHVKGYIDLVAESTKKTRLYDEGKVLVLDYKSAAEDWKKFTVQTDLQILIYSYSIRYILKVLKTLDLPNQKEDYVGIITLIKKKKTLKKDSPWGKVRTHLIKIEDEEIFYLENLLDQVVRRIKESGDDPKNYIPSPSQRNCTNCPYQSPCLMVRKGADNQDLDEWFSRNKKKFKKRKGR